MNIFVQFKKSDLKYCLQIPDLSRYPLSLKLCLRSEFFQERAVSN
jgi:hypothetical protein